MVEEHTNWRTTRTQIVAGEFYWENESDRPKDLDHHPSPIFADLFFFEDSTGYAETYSTDGHGNLNMLGTPANFPTGCNILPGTFGCLGRDDGGWLGWTNLMFYNRVTNKGTIFALDGSNRWIATENFDLSGIQSVPFPNAPLDLTVDLHGLAYRRGAGISWFRAISGWPSLTITFSARKLNTLNID